MTIKELRKIKGLTQSEVSEILAIPLRTYKRYESNGELENSFKYRQIYQLIEKIPAKSRLKTKKGLDIVVIGIGYVGLSLASLLSLDNNVIAMDINQEKIDLLNKRTCFIKDPILEKMFKKDKLNLKAMYVNEEELKHKDFIIISTNTDFDSETGQFNMESVISSISLVRKVNPSILIVIKSTVPMGFTKSLNDPNIIFCPEFLREGNAAYDNLYPSRIIIGADNITPKVKKFAKCLTQISINNKSVTYMPSKEAEAVKLFSNAYLAMRVAYFNELDTYAETNDLLSDLVIKGISMDPRIGDYYNNPSFGYGGYCLPKDTEQLKNSFLNISNNNIIKAIVESNQTRKEYIFNQIINKLNKKKEDAVIGIYRLVMKKDSDNYRNSSTLDIVKMLIDNGYKVIIYEPNYNSNNTYKNINDFLNDSDIIVANRMDDTLLPFVSKVYTRDLSSKN